MTNPPAIEYPRHPAHLDAYVEVFGPELAVQFLIAFGGAPLYFPGDPKVKSMAEALSGAERMRTLGARMPDNCVCNPMPRAWLIFALTAEGKGTSEICRRLKTTNTNVLRTCRQARSRGKGDRAA
ncbi:hypothetical protein ACN2XU_21115 [Primorskyibacter sp. 2E107]|uniref:hypothetical protein n=1 Tax=Primorskyibacter sp. 2E107 TaxID=3403458 RepID=UPI003AF46BC2